MAKLKQKLITSTKIKKNYGYGIPIGNKKIR